MHFETTAGASLPHSRQLVAPLLGDANARVFGVELGLDAPAIERLRSAATI